MTASKDNSDLVAKINARGPTSGFTDVDEDAEKLPTGFDIDNAKIFKPLKVGSLTLQHRIVHAALGRSRAINSAESPLAVKYFAQRTTPGALMISQATGTSLESKAWPWSANLVTEEHKTALANVISVVHEKGGFWFQQLTHVGRVTSPGLVKLARRQIGLKDPPYYGYAGVSASAVGEAGLTPQSGEPYGIPHALTIDEIQEIVASFKRAAALAVSAGADGIEILSGNGFLLDQFLHDNINQRHDQYGGSVENRSRLTLEVVDAVAEVVGYQHVGVRLSPFSIFHETDGSQPLEQSLHLCRELVQRGVAYLHVAQARMSRNLSVEENLARLVAKGIAPEDISLKPFRRLLAEVKPSNPEHTPTVLVGNGGYTAAAGVLAVEEDEADAVSYGRRFISNPDLVQRLRLRRPLSPYDPSTFYTHGAQGYTTYSTWKDPQEDISPSDNQPVLQEVAESEPINAGNGEIPSKENAQTQKHRPKRVAVIGAGVSGLVTVAAFNRLGGFELKVFERKSVPGGIWVPGTVPTTVPQFPSPESSQIDPPLPRPDIALPGDAPRSTRQRFLSSPIYESLVANIPYSVMGGATELTLPRPANPDSSYLTAPELSAFISKVATKHNYLIQYNTSVEDVRNLPEGGVRLLLRRENAGGTDTWYEEEFDHLIVATGHNNNVPRVPDISGLDAWKGGLQHSVTWRSGEELKNKRTLVVGTSESAIDIVLQSLPHVKGDIHVSQKSLHPRYPNIFQRPGVKVVTTIDHFTEDEIHLVDGTVLRDIDHVVFATGYIFSHPFLSNVRPPVGPEGHRVPGLYQHIFDIHNPNTIAFVGMVNVSLTWLTWEKSAFLIALVWSGKVHLPSKEIQERWEQDRLEEKGERLFHILDLPYERVLFFDEINELAAEYLSQEGADDTLLRGFPFQFTLDLIASRPEKLKYYGITEDVGGRGVPGSAALFSDSGDIEGHAAQTDTPASVDSGVDIVSDETKTSALGGEFVEPVHDQVHQAPAVISAA